MLTSFLLAVKHERNVRNQVSQHESSMENVFHEASSNLLMNDVNQSVSECLVAQ